MTEQEYAVEVMRTYAGSEAMCDKLCLGALGLAGESGEVTDAIKKVLFQGNALDRMKLGDELGDVLWYFMLICQVLGYSLEELMRRNADKLRRRYPDGFSSAYSIHRTADEEGENPR